MSNINFDNAYLLLLAVPLIVLFTVGFALVTRKENVNGRSIASYVMHIVMALIIAFAAAGTTITTMLTETNVYVVADVSYSARKNFDAIDGYIRGLELPRNSKLGVVCFGKDFEVINDMGDPDNFKSVKNANVDDSETNIAEALEYTATLFKDDVIKRIVLITDGRYTDDSDSYSVKRAVDNLEMQGIIVDAIYVDSNLVMQNAVEEGQEYSKEVQISDVEFTPTAFLNGQELINVIVQSSYDVDAIISLYRNGEKLGDIPQSLTVGYNTVSFEITNLSVGTFDYKVTVSAEGDDSEYNNSYNFTQIVTSDLKVLAITTEWSDAVTVIERYGGLASVEVYENSSVAASVKNEFLKKYAGNSKIIVHNDLNVPFAIEDLCKYDEIILADVGLSDMTNWEHFAVNIDTVVSVFGKSLITMGDLKLQNRNEEEITKFKNLLPVSYGGSAEPKLYTFVIDSSRSMGHRNRLELAKDLCARLIDVLNDKDRVCVVTFNGEVRLVQAPRPLTSRSDIIDAINNLEVRQGTVIGSGLELAYTYMDNDTLYSEKQVMLISDGNNFGAGSDEPVAIAEKMYDSGIYTSVYDVGMGDYPSGRRLMTSIASAGHGSYFEASIDGELSDAAFGQVASRVTESIVLKNTSVTAVRRDDVMTGLSPNYLTNITGYLYSSAKASATTVLAVNHAVSNGTVARPLYAYWSYGNGRVSTFNSQMSGNWITGWADNGFMPLFMDSILKVNTPVMKSAAPYSVNVVQLGKSAHIELTPAVPRLNATAKIEVERPDGKVFLENLSFNASYYFFDFPTVGQGKYSVKLTYNYYGTDYVVDASFNISYASEYNAFATFDTSALHKAIDGRGTVVEEQSLKIENDVSKLATYNMKLTVPLLIVAVSLFVVDIIVRKLRWNDIKTFFSFLKKIGAKRSEVK